MVNWAGIVLLEIKLLLSDSMHNSTMQKQPLLLNDYIKKLNRNCKNCSSQQKDKLTEFTMALKQGRIDYVKSFNG